MNKEISLGKVLSITGGISHFPNLQTTFSGVQSIKNAGEDDICFFDNNRYLNDLTKTKAKGIIVPIGFKANGLKEKILIYSKNPSKSFDKVLSLFTRNQSSKILGIHRSVVIGKNVKLGKNVSIGAFCFIDDDVVIGDDVTIYPHCFIGRAVKIGEGSTIYSSVNIREHCLIGKFCIIHCGAVIGDDGFGYFSSSDGHEKVQQIGIVVLEDEVEVGSNSCIDRARFEKTIIGRGTKIDNLVQIGHNVIIGENCLICGLVGIAGSVHIGNFVTFGGMSGATGHIKIGDYAKLSTNCIVTKDIKEKEIVYGYPATDKKTFAQKMLLHKKVERLSKEIEKLKNSLKEENQEN